MQKFAYLFLADSLKTAFYFLLDFFNSPFVLCSPFKVRPAASRIRISPAPGHTRRRSSRPAATSGRR
jgi:hypothetical protein